MSEDIKEKLKTLPKDEIQRIIRELLGKETKPRQKEIPEEIKGMVEKYQQLREQLREIKHQLKQHGYTPTGLTIRKGYGNYDYRGTKAYETVKEILSRARYTAIERLEEELKAKGYKGITGTIGVVLKNLKEDGLIRRVGDSYEWLGELPST